MTREVAQAALALYDVDVLGLDRLDRAVLEALVVRFGGGPVGVSTLAVAVGEEPNTVEEVCEPFLVRAGLLARTPRGRVATEAAWRHLGHPLPRGGVLLGGSGGGAPAHRGPRVRRQSPCSAHRLRSAGAQLRQAVAVRVPPGRLRAPHTDVPERARTGPHPTAEHCPR